MTTRQPIRVRAAKTDRARKSDVVVIEHAGRERALAAWKQGSLPHELVHAAVERAFGLRGFVRIVASGVAPAEATNDTVGAEGRLAEALTNAFQYELSGLVEPGDAGVRALVTTFLRETPSIDDVDLARCRDLLHDLARRWSALAAGEEIELDP